MRSLVLLTSTASCTPIAVANQLVLFDRSISTRRLITLRKPVDRESLETHRQQTKEPEFSPSGTTVMCFQGLHDLIRAVGHCAVSSKGARSGGRDVQASFTSVCIPQTVEIPATIRPGSR